VKEKLLQYYQKYMYVVGLGGHFIFVFQAYKIWLMQSSVDVSLSGFLSCFWAVCSWLVYGWLISNRLLIMVNSFGVIAGLICLIMIVLYS